MILGALSVLRDLERIYAPSDLLKQPSCLSVVVSRRGTRAGVAMLMAGLFTEDSCQDCHLFCAAILPATRCPNRDQCL